MPKRLVMLDKPVYAFSVEEETGELGFDPEVLDNIRLYLNGRPIVLRYGQICPNEDTAGLLKVPLEDNPQH